MFYPKVKSKLINAGKNPDEPFSAIDIANVILPPTSSVNCNPANENKSIVC